MISTTCNGVSYYQFENLAQFADIDHGIFTRSAGHSQPPFASLNISFGIGDEKKAVARNRGIISGIMGPGDMTYLDQVHGCDIAVLGRNQNGPRSHLKKRILVQDQGGAELQPAGILKYVEDLKRGPNAEVGPKDSFEMASNHPVATRPLIADAVVTDRPDNYLVIQVADCQSVLMYEPARQVVANVHSGWRGSIGNIIGRTVEAMRQHFDCRPDGIRAGIGPSLGPCCAEFINYKTEIPQTFWQYKDSDDHFDFWAISFDQLINAGIPADNIESSRMCTRCRTDEFYSYRAEKTTGRFAAVIGLKQIGNDS